MRKLLFWLHLIAGISAGLVIVIMSATGTLLMYEKQITAWADGYRVVPPSTTAAASIEQLLARARAEKPEATLATVTLLADRTAPAAIELGREGTLFLNPYTAEVLGEGSKGARAFFRSVTDWHRWLALQGDRRATGRAVTGASNLLFLFIVVSGLCLWWPRSFKPASFKSIVLFRQGLDGKARDFNWHNVLGFWSAIPLFFVVATAVVISYPWAGDLLYRVTGNEPPPRPSPTGARPAGGGVGAGGQAGGSPTTTTPVIDVEGLDALWAVASKEAPGWRTLSLRVPASRQDPVTFSVNTSTGAIRPDRRSQLVLDRASGGVMRRETYASQNRGRQLRTWARWVHTGEAFGLPGQTLAGLASAGVLVLAWTGFSLSWRRFRVWRARRGKSRSEETAREPALSPKPIGTSV